jgi:hypothetical protein
MFLRHKGSLTKHAIYPTSTWKNCTHNSSTHQPTSIIQMKQGFKLGVNMVLKSWLGGVHMMFITPSLNFKNASWLKIVLLMQEGQPCLLLHFKGSRMKEVYIQLCRLEICLAMQKSHGWLHTSSRTGHFFIINLY